MSAANPTQPVDIIAAVRDRREASNAAIAALDPAKLAAFAEDGVAVTTSAGKTCVGRQAMYERFQELFARQKELTLVRSPVAFEASTSQPHVYETGRWIHQWTENDVRIDRNGVYTTFWVLTENLWRLSAEVYVELECKRTAANPGTGGSPRR